MNIEDRYKEDIKYIERVKAGNTDAYGYIVEKYQNIIAQQMWRYSRDLHDVEDLTQQVFINAYNSIHNYKPKAPFVHWLKTIASRTGYRFWREKSKIPALVELEDWDGASYDFDNAGASPKEAEAELNRLLDNLQPNERNVICLLYLDGNTVKEISAITGWSKGKIKMLAYRGRRKLREFILESRRIENNE